MNMSYEEIMECPWNLFQDLLACDSIYKGRAVPKRKKLSFDEAMALR